MLNPETALEDVLHTLGKVNCTSFSGCVIFLLLALIPTVTLRNGNYTVEQDFTQKTKGSHHMTVG